MRPFPIFRLIVVTLFLYRLLPAQVNVVTCPVGAEKRVNLNEIHLTEIGDFGHLRKARPSIPAHLHTGIDIRRPVPNYNDEPIFPIYPGWVISLRDDGPFAQIIIEHQFSDGNKFWSVYEHIAGIKITLSDSVSPGRSIARFMNHEELDRFGWQFDHFHLEILKKAPRPITPKADTPFRYYMTYNLECYSQQDLERYYFDPLEFLKKHSGSE
jgi:hypothetical protein